MDCILRRSRIIMSNFLKMTMPAMVLAYLIFYFIYKKMGAEKLINCKTSIRLTVFFIAFILGLVFISITDSFEATKGYHSLFMGIFTGASVGIVPFVVPVNNKKSKS